jgi:hypothetical protein
MSINLRLRNLNRAKDEFVSLSIKARRKANIYKSIDICIKAILSIGGGLITFFADPGSIEEYKIAIRLFGIVIASLTALASVFMFEKRSLSNIQVYNKCQIVVPDIEYKIDAIKNGENLNEDFNEYIKKIFRDLSSMNLATFTDSALEKINSNRNI